MQTLELLCSVLLVGTSLLEDLDIVLRVLVLQSRSNLLSLLDTIGPRVTELVNDSVEGLDGATSSIETSTDSAVSSCVGVEELDKVLLAAGARVWEGLGGALGEVLDRGVA